MAITRLKRKGRKNKQTAALRRSSIKQLTSKPVIKNVDVEEIKKGFKTSTKEAKPKKEAKAEKEAPKAEVADVKKEKVAKKPAAKKAAPKKTAPKKEA
ncbi:MAG: hypothetical protein OEW67_05175 [Cyclobacteriaceae bacterium]|nr:hypothetical protein [Cyclobacteriaceae bacterium]